MRKLFWDDRGGSVIDFALVSLPVVLFIFGIIQTGWIMWADNLLNVAVDTAARCGAVGSTTAPCNGSVMVATAEQVFGPLDGASFSTTAQAAQPMAA